ncbi:hypothetical protein HHI36_012079 [Cryptolaemus montrouzieri]|uniref:Gem-associated protein 2 n=1 Tax=Cryptolaemus montrouzieri TaxID=559131 RepID=A0ABD2NE68_9CUCU
MSDEEYNSDSSIASDYGLLKKALPFEAVIPENFDPNKIPETADEFLQYAAYERSLTKPWIKAEIDPSKLTCNINEPIGKKPKDSNVSNYLPTQEWQKEKLDEFIELREFLQPRITNEPSSSRLRVDENVLVNNRPNYYELEKYSQNQKMRILEIIVDHLEMLDEGSMFGFNIGCWIYAILSLLDSELTGYDCSTVRMMVKKCISIRSELKNGSKKEYDPLNLFICVATKFYRQHDLSDP